MRITGAPTSVAAFIGRAPSGVELEHTLCRNFGDYERELGGLHPDSTMSYAVRDFFAHGGTQAVIVRVAANDDAAYIDSLRVLETFNILCIPPPVRGGRTSAAIYASAAAHCRERRAMLLVDPPPEWDATSAVANKDSLGVTGIDARNAALYFPRLIERDPLRRNQLDAFVPCGAVAGIYAAMDARRGVWKAPAGAEARLTGVEALSLEISDLENGPLNVAGINCLRKFRALGLVVWGARTMRGADAFADEFKYVPVRRFSLFLEESIDRGTTWTVYESNDEPLWAKIRASAGAFLHELFRQGAFQGQTPREAYFVKCDRETTTQADIDAGIVNIVVGFAPLKPAEFVIIRIAQHAGRCM